MKIINFLCKKNYSLENIIKIYKFRSQLLRLFFLLNLFGEKHLLTNGFKGFLVYMYKFFAY